MSFAIHDARVFVDVMLMDRNMPEYKEIQPGWMAAPATADEAERIELLHKLKILDTGQEPVFDRITELAARLYGVPMATISFVDKNRQWFKSRVGLDASEMPREQAFCAHAILESRVMVVLDALMDFRFKGNPLVTGEPYIRFYAGAPLVCGGGLRIGVLCLIDNRPRAGFSGKQEENLRLLARHVSNELEVRLLERSVRQPSLVL